MELVQNQSFTLTIGDSKQSRLRRLKDSVTQGSVLAPLVLNIYCTSTSALHHFQKAYLRRRHSIVALLKTEKHFKGM